MAFAPNKLTVDRSTQNQGAKLDAIAPRVEDITGQERLHTYDRYIVDNLPSIIVVLAPSGACLSVNAAGCRISGYLRDEIIGRSFWRLLFPQDSYHQVEDLFAAYAKNGEVKDYEMTITTRTGDQRLISWTSISRYDEEGRLLETVAIGDDITARRRNEAALLRSEALLADAQRVAHVGCWEHNTTDNTMWWSDEAARIFEIGPGRNGDNFDEFLELVHPDDRVRVNTVYRKAISAHELCDVVYRILHTDDRISCIHARGETTYAMTGDPIRTVGTVQDVTVRIEQDQKLRETLAETQELKEYTEHIVQYSPSFIVGISPDGTAISINASGCRISGYERDEILGANLWSMLFPGEKYRQVKMLFDQFDEKGFVRDYEMTIETKSGENRILSLTSVNRFDKQGVLLEIIAVAEDVTDLKRSRQELEHLAHHDPLTDLPNRLLLTARLEQALSRARRRSARGALLFLDLDRFKNVNDSLGHPAGDALLVEVAQRLRDCVRVDDTVARISGDEFTVLIEDIESPNNAARVAEKIIDAFGKPFELSGRELYVTPSIGIGIFPNDGDDVQSILRNADAAMYQAKCNGRNAYAFYTTQLTRHTAERVQLENSLRKAIENEELRLYYQPQNDLATGAVIGSEALIRWQHPEQGLLQPGQFLGVAEDSGLIVPMGEWVLYSACDQAKAWLDAGLEFGRVAVNVAGAQISRGELVGVVEMALDVTGLPANRLEIEITEGFVMQEAADTVAILDKLRELGVTLAIDDFGTGYSSLWYLKRLPFDRLKIDRSFVMDIPTDANDVAITRAVIALGKSLQLEVLAEGVETEAQRQFLLHEGCRLGQGFLFSKPIAPAAFTELLSARAAAASGA